MMPEPLKALRSNEVPPTEMTNGIDAVSSTLGTVSGTHEIPLNTSLATPWSPAAQRIVCPCICACCTMLLMVDVYSVEGVAPLAQKKMLLLITGQDPSVTAA